MATGGAKPRSGKGHGGHRMARIAGVDIPRDRRVVASLPVIYGIGPTNAQKILDRTNISPDKRVRDLSEDEVNRIREIIDRSSPPARSPPSRRT